MTNISNLFQLPKFSDWFNIPLETSESDSFVELLPLCPPALAMPAPGLILTLAWAFPGAATAPLLATIFRGAPAVFLPAPDKHFRPTARDPLQLDWLMLCLTVTYTYT